MVVGASESSIGNSKRLSRPTAHNWADYINGELSSSLGKLLSCPSSNLKTFNVDAGSVNKWGRDEIIDSVMVSRAELEAQGVRRESVIEDVRQVCLTDAGGIPKGKLVFPESQVVSSKVEREIFGDSVSRDGSVNSALAEGGHASSRLSYDSRSA